MSQQLGIKVDLAKSRWAFDQKRSELTWLPAVSGFRPMIAFRVEITSEGKHLIDLADERVAQTRDRFPDARLSARDTDLDSNALQQTLLATSKRQHQEPVVLTAKLRLIPGVRPHTQLCYELVLIADPKMSAELAEEFATICATARVEVTET